MEEYYRQPQISKYLFNKAFEKRTPLDGTFELSPICNLDCKMCYIRMTKEEVNKIGREKTVDEWLDLAKQAKEEGMLFLLLTGGEPFLYKDFKRLYKELKKMGLMITINTNGTVIDEKVIEWLSKDPPYRMNITLYGSSNETYKKLCNDHDGFNKVKKAIKLLKDANIQFKLNASFTQYNIDDMEEIFKFASENQLYIQTTTYMFPPTRKDENNVGVGNRFTSEECAINSVKIDKLRFSKEEFKVRAESMKKDYMSKLEQITSDNYEQEGENMRCRAGKSSFWITWDGKMTPCGMMNRPFERPFENGFINSWNKITKITDEIRISSECSKCANKNICQVCPAMALCETGETFEKPQYICNVTEKYYEETQRYYKELVSIK